MELSITTTAVFAVRRLGTVVRARIEKGSLRPAQLVHIVTSESFIPAHVGHLLSVQTRAAVDEAHTGDEVAFVVKNTIPEDVPPGSRIVSPDAHGLSRADGTSPPSNAPLVDLEAVWE